jgi:hypothetical protein
VDQPPYTSISRKQCLIRIRGKLYGRRPKRNGTETRRCLYLYYRKHDGGCTSEPDVLTYARLVELDIEWAMNILKKHKQKFKFARKIRRNGNGI